MDDLSLIWSRMKLKWKRREIKVEREYFEEGVGSVARTLIFGNLWRRLCRVGYKGED
jgi:hypothetical protein